MPEMLDTAVFSLRAVSSPVVTTEADSAAPFFNRTSREAWQTLIDEKLIEWGANPEFFDDEDFESPGREIIALAIQLAHALRDANEPAPHRVVPDADGGIVFERRVGASSQKIHIWDDGIVERIVMDGTQVVDRSRLL